MPYQQPETVFCYAYRPLNPMAVDGGFTVNLQSNGLLIFNTYTEHGDITSELQFQLDQGLVNQYKQMVRYAFPWLRNVPARIQNDEAMTGEYSFGFNGLRLFRIENLPAIMEGEFRNRAAHYARKVYALLEDVSVLLLRRGIFLSLDSFQWSDEMIRPLPQQGSYANMA